MRSNPKPVVSFCLLERQRPVLPPDTNRPQIFLNAPEMQRRVQWVILQQGVVLVRQFPHLFRQGVIVVPKVRRGKMVHKKSARNFQRQTLPRLPLLPDPLPQRIKAARLDILRDLPLPCLGPVVLNPLQQCLKFPRRKLGNRRLYFFDTHGQSVPAHRPNTAFIGLNPHASKCNSPPARAKEPTAKALIFARVGGSLPFKARRV